MEHDKTDLNVSSSSDPNKIANAVICIIKERGQAVMKAGGGNALFVAMSAIINARRRLKRNHHMDLMVSVAGKLRTQLGPASTRISRCCCTTRGCELNVCI
jgi:stage V sporulation protein SpoVS